MAKAPAFQWYPGDCDTDENVRGMDDAEFGFYVRCLNHSWLNHGLPTDIGEFARVMGKTPRQFLKLWVRVSRCFFENSEKRFVNSRQEQQRADQESFRKSRVEAAKSMHANKSTLHVHPKNDAQGMHVQCSSSSSSSSTSIKKDSEAPTELTPLDSAIEQAGSRIFARHPTGSGKKNASKEYVTKRLRAIVKEISGVPEKIAKVTEIDAKHEVLCKSERWTEEKARYADGLRNWISGNEKRYEIPLPPSRDSPTPTIRLIPNIDPYAKYDPNSPLYEPQPHAD